MITPAEYMSELLEIQNLSITTPLMVNPTTEPVFAIDANSREIIVPDDLQIVGALNDHNAETIYFTIDRYFDNADLYDMACAVQYINAAGEKHLYAVTGKTLIENDEKVMFGWTISSNVTCAVGKVKFSIRFFKIDPNTYEFNYNFNTAIATVKIIESLDNTNDSETLPKGDDIDLLLDRTQEIADKINEITQESFDYEKNIINKPSINGTILNGQLATENLKLDYSKLLNLPTINGKEIIGNVDIVLDIDSELSQNSTNPVQNKVIFEELEKIKMELNGMTYVPIDIINFNVSPNIVEKGSTLENATFNWSLNKIPSILTLDSISLNPSSNMISQNVNLTEDKTFNLVAQDAKGNTAIKTTSIAFYNGIYYGVKEDINDFNNDFILSLTQQLNKDNNLSFSTFASEGEYIYYCCPTAYGTAIFSVGGFDGGFSKVATIEFTNSSSFTESYDIYKSDNPNLGSITIQVNKG